MIGFLEQVQTDLDKELKALQPKEQEAAQGPVDALRPRIQALPRVDAPAAPAPVAPAPAMPAQPVVAPPSLGLSAAVRLQMGAPAPLAAPVITYPARAFAQPYPTKDADAFRQMVLHNQELVRQQILQSQQEIFQRSDEIIRHSQRHVLAVRR
jgi:hypothetical protein